MIGMDEFFGLRITAGQRRRLEYLAREKDLRLTDICRMGLFLIEDRLSAMTPEASRELKHKAILKTFEDRFRDA
jgi:hypothetical protein